ncbi:MAG: ABC transporter permease [Chloroflexia bacterium]
MSSRRPAADLPTAVPSTDVGLDAPPSVLPTTIVRSDGGWVSLDLPELWRYRELLFFFVWSEVNVRYKQTTGRGLGGDPAVHGDGGVQHLLWKLANIPSDGKPHSSLHSPHSYPGYFANALRQASNSILQYGVITKVYFRRLILPLASVLSGLVDFSIAFLVLLGLMLYYGVAPTLAVVTLPFFLLLAVATATSIGLWLAALNVEYRDIRFVTPFIIQFWLFATPIVYPTSLVPEGIWRTLYGLNPMTGVVEGFRWALLGRSQGPGPLLAVSVAVVVASLVGGLYYFRRVEQTFADVV